MATDGKSICFHNIFQLLKFIVSSSNALDAFDNVDYIPHYQILRQYCAAWPPHAPLTLIRSSIAQMSIQSYELMEKQSIDQKLTETSHLMRDIDIDLITWIDDIALSLQWNYN